MSREKIIIAIKLAISLSTLVLAFNIYLTNRLENPNCLWNDVQVVSRLCNMTNNKNILNLNIEKKYIKDTEPTFIINDLLWIVMIILLLITTIMDMVTLCTIYCEKKINIDYYNYA